VIGSTDQAHGGFSVFCGVGERTREGNDLYHEMITSKVFSKIMFVSHKSWAFSSFAIFTGDSAEWRIQGGSRVRTDERTPWFVYF
jgi:hypothetical protein